MKMKMMCPHDRGGGGGTKWRGFSIVSSQVMAVEIEKVENQRKRGTQGKSKGKFLRHLYMKYLLWECTYIVYTYMYMYVTCIYHYAF